MDILINIITTLSGAARQLLGGLGGEFAHYQLDPIGVLAVGVLIYLVWRFAL